jgi:2-methylisocitrate lyase-like PEP mutase family enzyme
MRAGLYREAGADCVYPILLAEEPVILAFVMAAGVINLNLRPGGPLSLQRTAALGVRRVTYAASLFRHTIASLERLTAELRAETQGLPGSS